MKSNWTKSRLFCFIRVFQFLQFVLMGVLLISIYEWQGWKQRTRRKKNLYSVVRQVFDHIHDNETKPTFEKYSLFSL